MELIWELCKIDQLFSMKAKCRYSDTLYTGPAKQIIAWWPINYYQQDSSRKDITQVCQTCMLKKTFLNLSGYFHSSFVAYDYISSIARLDCTQSVIFTNMTVALRARKYVFILYLSTYLYFPAIGLAKHHPFPRGGVG